MKPKFRVWDKEEKKMHKVKTIEFSRRGARIIHLAEVQSNGKGDHKRWHSSVELMQSTGLIDKNGVEIYEGDIVRYNRGVSYSVEKFPYSVKYIEGAFVFEHGFIQHNLFKNVKYVTVIGNIYENPELLEDE
ncbi:YopX family protein [Staphylococcus haemolyticus]|uniref:YopX family protein n=1 Tax=Staphylococcus haemolyticus TaxID=1283 RepID=UPI00069ED5C1|nr:YopX family protein [Staphylococcus haemolyticus]